MLCCLEESQMDAIVRAGTLCADALMGGHRIYVTRKERTVSTLSSHIGRAVLSWSKS